MAARIAILSDIHANLPALEAVLEDLAEQGCGEICCLGDLHFREQESALCFIGHTHRPMVWRVGDECGRLPSDPVKIDLTTKQLINVGSVGQPRDGDARACYAIYDLEKSEVVWRRVAYNIPLAQNAIEDAGLPILFADRLSEGK